MCYSALIKKNLRNVAQEFGARIDVDEYVKLYAMREIHPEMKIPDGLEDYFLKEGGSAAKKIKASIEVFNEAETGRLLQEISAAEAEMTELEARLKVKVTKTNQGKLESKIRVRDRLRKKIEAITKKREGSEDFRIYPFYFAPVILADGKDRVMVPMRYRILPPSGVEIPGGYNVFNARRDSLQEARTWKALFGKKHAIFPFLKFYEWVESPKGEKMEIKFSPDGFEGMWAASLYEETRLKGQGLLRSFAMVTDDPPAEVAAAGHDRCPVFLDHRYLDMWLHPEGHSLEELDLLLNSKEPTYYSHVQAA